MLAQLLDHRSACLEQQRNFVRRLDRALPAVETAHPRTDVCACGEALMQESSSQRFRDCAVATGKPNIDELHL
jgi:hypothetical protein